MTIQNRYDFVMLFDVENGNPNGDPDFGNTPRIDPETNFGYVTDVCLKRKIRNYVELVKEGEPEYNILIKPDKALNSKFTDAYRESNLKTGNKGADNDAVLTARKYMCQNYFDVRTFGAVMSTGDDPCGIVRGPVQLNFARSIDKIHPQEITIARTAQTTQKDFEEKGSNTFGKKNIVPYGLYRGEGYISAALAQKVTGFSEDDLALLWEAIINMFENDHSAARGKMTMRKLFVFRHESVLGNAPSGLLFDKITVSRKASDVPPRAFSDYEVTVDRTLPAGVELLELL